MSFEVPQLRRPITLTNRRSVRDVLLGARRILKEVGWTQGTSRERDTEGYIVGFCAMGALMAAAGRYTGRTPRAVSKSGVLALDTASYIQRTCLQRQGLTPWNDAPQRTHREVLALFDKAIRLRKRGVRA